VKRPTSITILALYLLIVFSLSIIMSFYGFSKQLAPYSRGVWLALMIPKVLAISAGVAFWKMLRIGAWLWFGGVVIGWIIAVTLAGVWPNLTLAAAVSLVIVGLSVWAIVQNWHLLRPLGELRTARSEASS